jgi:hypothetical protein
MEIEFNTNRIGQSGAAQPAARRTPASSPDGDGSLATSAALEQKLRDLPLVRPEKVERARALVADVKYPPEEMLISISHLLALKMKI